VDVGASGNLMGSRWLERQSAVAAAAGRTTQILPLQPTLKVEGVGKKAQECSQIGIVPLGIPQLGKEAEYRAPIIPDSDVPALFGLSSLQSKHAIIDCATEKLIFPGPGGVQMRLSPGSVVIQLEKSESGHLLLPCSEFSKVPSHEKHVSFNVIESEVLSSPGPDNNPQQC
jgi:hypothetical protein